MKNRPVRHRIEYIFFLLTRRLLLLLDHVTVQGLGGAVGRLYFRLADRRRELALTNLQQTLPELDQDQRLETTRRCFEHYGATFFEVVSAERFSPAEIEERFEVHGWEHLEAAEAHGRGYFLVAGHYGAWELSLLPLSQRLDTIHIVARPPDNPHVSRDAETIRKSRGNILLARKGAAHGMLKVLRKRGRIAIVIDQRVAPWKGVLVPFMGRPAWTTPVPAFLSIHTGAPVLPISCVQTEGGRYRVDIEPMILPEGKGELAEAELTRRYLLSLEQQIRRRPEMWLWMHRRWQLTQPKLIRKHTERLHRGARLPTIGNAESLGDLELAEGLGDRLQQLSNGAFLESSSNLLLTGGSAELRDQIASVFGRALIENGKSVRFARAAQLAGELTDAEAAGRTGKLLRDLDACDLLILGDLDSESVTSSMVDTLGDLIGQRRRRRSTLLSGNLGPENWRSGLRTNANLREFVGESDCVKLDLT